MDRRETERLLESIAAARAAGERVALATVVRVRGSAYRREGTRMFVRQDGTYECALSGGCLEPAVAEAARRVIATGVPVTATYDLAEDSIWGLGIGCSGAVDIRIERVEDDAVTNEWLAVLQRGAPAVLVTPLAGSGRLIVRATGDIIGALTDPVVEREAVTCARERLSASNPQSGLDELGGGDVFFEVSSPPPSLVVFGAGYDSVPLVTHAWTLGFAVTVVDAREAYLSADRFPGATLISAHYSRFAEAVTLDARTIVLVMNHHIERDRQSLRFALDSEAAYIGVLGPRSRYQKLLDGLAAEGYVPNPARLTAVRSPVGLSLGAETPEEVALSILSEILAVRRGFEGGSLSGLTSSLHRPDEKRLLARS
jgi:xanthine dehydrogenase accessory factor